MKTERCSAFQMSAAVRERIESEYGGGLCHFRDVVMESVWGPLLQGHG